MNHRFVKTRDFFRRRLSGRGYTLIELMVVITIIAIITAIVAANYHAGNRQVVLDMQVNEFAQDLRKMQEWSFAAHEVPVGYSPGRASMPGYGIYVAKDSESYYLYTDNDNDKKYSSGDTVQQTVYLDSKLEITSCSPSPASINFIPPDPITVITDHLTNSTSTVQASVTFQIKGASSKRTVVVNGAGLIYVQ